MQNERPILTITGSDSTSASGVQADIRTIARLGGYAVTAITCITVQNTLGIQEFHDLSPQVVRGQIEALVNDVEPQTVKVGMLRSVETVDVVADAILHYGLAQVLYVPVVFSAQGEQLMTEAVGHRIRERLLPLCTAIVCRRRDAALLLQSTADQRVHLLDDDMGHGQANTFASALAFFMNKGMKEGAFDEAWKAYRAQQGCGLQGRGAELFDDFRHLLEQHICTNRDVHFYAETLGVGSVYLAQVTRRACRQSPKSLIDNRLLSEAERLLTTTTLTVQEVAYHLGFTSQAHFAKFFKKQRGHTPSDFRRLFTH